MATAWWPWQPHNCIPMKERHLGHHKHGQKNETLRRRENQINEEVILTEIVGWATVVDKGMGDGWSDLVGGNKSWSGWPSEAIPPQGRGTQRPIQSMFNWFTTCGAGTALTLKYPSDTLGHALIRRSPHTGLNTGDVARKAHDVVELLLSIAIPHRRPPGTPPSLQADVGVENLPVPTISPALRQADKLLTDLSSMRTQMKGYVHDAEKWKYDIKHLHEEAERDRLAARRRAALGEPAPIESYLATTSPQVGQTNSYSPPALLPIWPVGEDVAERGRDMWRSSPSISRGGPADSYPSLQWSVNQLGTNGHLKRRPLNEWPTASNTSWVRLGWELKPAALRHKRATAGGTSSKCPFMLRVRYGDVCNPCTCVQVCNPCTCVQVCNPCTCVQVCNPCTCVQVCNPCTCVQVCNPCTCAQVCNPCTCTQVCNPCTCAHVCNPCTCAQVCNPCTCVQVCNPCTCAQVCNPCTCVQVCNPCTCVQVCNPCTCVQVCNPCTCAQVCNPCTCVQVCNPCTCAQVCNPCTCAQVCNPCTCVQVCNPCTCAHVCNPCTCAHVCNPCTCAHVCNPCTCVQVCNPCTCVQVCNPCTCAHVCNPCTCAHVCNPCTCAHVCNPCTCVQVCNPCTCVQVCNPCTCSHVCNPCTCVQVCNPCTCAQVCNPCTCVQVCKPCTCAQACNPCTCVQVCNPCTCVQVCNPCTCVQVCNPCTCSHVCNPCTCAQVCNPCTCAQVCNPCAHVCNPCTCAHVCNPCTCAHVCNPCTCVQVCNPCTCAQVCNPCTCAQVCIPCTCAQVCNPCTCAQVTVSRRYLEDNLEAVMRAKDQSQLYQLMDSLHQEGPSADRARIRREVDAMINQLTPEVEDDVMKHLTRNPKPKKVSFVEEQVPERDTGPGVPQSEKSQPKTVRGRAQPRINTGLRRPPKAAKSTGKEKGPVKSEERSRKSPVKEKSKQTRDVPFYEQDETYLTRVYGKARHNPHRTTEKQPYLHFNSPPPRTKAPRPKPAVDTKGTIMKSIKTQTKEKPAPGRTAGPTGQYYFSPAAPYPQAGVPTPQQGQLIPMAIPLGAPRIESSHNQAVPLVAHTALPNRTQGTARPNVATVTMVTDKDARKPKLSVQVMPAVDIDSIPQSPASDTAPKATFPPEIPSTDQPVGRPDDTEYSEFPHYGAEVEDEAEEIDEIERDLKQPGTGMTVEGDMREEGREYHGPPFPPQPPPPEVVQPSSEVLAEELRRRNQVENRAVEWIEAELMAQVINQLYPAQRQESPPEPSDSGSSAGEADTRDPGTVSAIGQAGLQLFVDAGVAVDTELVQRLVREVLEEKVAAMMGQHERQRATPPPPPPSQPYKEPSPARTSPKQVSPLHTPQPTPRTSPVPSPPRGPSPIATPEATPHSTPEPSPAESETENLHETLITPAPPPEEPSPPSPVEPTSPVPTPVPTPTHSPPPAVTPPLTPHTSPHPSELEVEPLPQFPLPWGDDVDLPLSEEAPPTAAQQPGTGKIEMSLSPTEEPTSLIQLPPPPVTPKSLPPPKESPSSSEHSPPPSESSSSSTITTVTETADVSLSEGEWLFSRGQAGAVGGLRGVAGGVGEIRSGDSSLASTLEGAEEMDHEQEPPSEGELLPKALSDVHKDPLLALLARVKQPVKKMVEKPALAQGVADNDASIGEVSEGQRPRLTQTAERVLLGEAQDTRRGSHGEAVGRTIPVDSTAPPEDSTMVLSDLERPSTRKPASAPRVISVASADDSSPRPSPRSRTPLAASRGQQRSGDSDTRPARVITVKAVPEDEVPEQGRTSQQGLQGTHTLSDMDTRTFTPDQMNLDALIQSGYLTQSLSQSDHSADLGRTGGSTTGLDTLNQSGLGMGRTGGSTTGINQSGLGTGRQARSFSLPVGGAEKEEDDPRRTSLVVSLTLPSIQGENDSVTVSSLEGGEYSAGEVSDISEISGGGF
ncbi:hypothetical protein Bbelb_423390 [Branchiostoma belcheri]|nr:hypothetical protein Bbelb_423390 [Branchiostoma belcheri]